MNLQGPNLNHRVRSATLYGRQFTLDNGFMLQYQIKQYHYRDVTEWDNDESTGTKSKPQS